MGHRPLRNIVQHDVSLTFEQDSTPYTMLEVASSQGTWLNFHSKSRRTYVTSRRSLSHHELHSHLCWVQGVWPSTTPLLGELDQSLVIPR